MITLAVPTTTREEMIDVTSQVRDALAQSGITDGVVTCFVPHTTAGITINENADPDVKRDILYKLNKEIPQRDGYHHGEGNSDAHIKASLLGSSVTIIVEGGRLQLGTWQGICFCEFDGPRRRKLLVHFQSA
ncbi:secondary thiamine-phosphate synthase enzyme YjbQ [bacterium]|nr:secondary thiamine-phosphate synthase enzyme YjbQ [bacterium]